MVGIEKFKRFLEDLDLLNKTQFDIEETGTPFLLSGANANWLLLLMVLELQQHLFN